MFCAIREHALHFNHARATSRRELPQTLTQRIFSNCLDDHRAGAVELLGDGPLDDLPRLALGAGQPPVSNPPHQRFRQALEPAASQSESRRVAGHDCRAKTRRQLVHKRRLSNARTARHQYQQWGVRPVVESLLCIDPAPTVSALDTAPLPIRTSRRVPSASTRE